MRIANSLHCDCKARDNFHVCIAEKSLPCLKMSLRVPWEKKNCLIMSRYGSDIRAKNAWWTWPQGHQCLAHTFHFNALSTMFKLKSNNLSATCTIQCLKLPTLKYKKTIKGIKSMQSHFSHIILSPSHNQLARLTKKKPENSFSSNPKKNYCFCFFSQQQKYVLCSLIISVL